MIFSKEGNPVFLAAFFERSKKYVSDYSRWMQVISNRYKEEEWRNNMSLNDMIALFKEKLSDADINAAILLSEISAAIVKERIRLGMTQK